MGFTTETFLFIFMPISIIVYLLVDRLHKIKVSNVLLLIMSLVFYAWAGLNTLLFFILLSGLVFILGNLVFYSKESGKEGRKWVCISAFLLIAVLIYFKYVPFLFDQISQKMGIQFSVSNLAVPISLSFVIFESVSYVIDIYRGDAEPGTLIDMLLFLSLFPKLISGPIVLWKDFYPQIKNRDVNLSGGGTEGINKIIIGFAKKAILADTFGAKIQTIETGMAASGIDAQTMWLRVILYFFQIYYDFSGYSDIAIGLCKVFGFSIKENFNFPYISTSISEFWRRWHISLGSWFREYVYIPLGGNRKGNVYINLFIVFLLTGIWHGANWTFIIWGMINGVFVVFERYIRDKTWYVRIPSFIKWLMTIAVIFFAWIMFMSPDIGTAISNYSALFTLTDSKIFNFTWKYYLTKKIIILLAIACVGSVLGAISLPDKVRKYFDTTLGELVQKAGYIIIIIISVLFIVNSTYSPFLYFQF